MTKARHGSRTTLSIAGLLVLAALALTMAGLPADAIGRDYVPDLLTPDRSHEEVDWLHDREAGPHLVFHYNNWNDWGGLVRVVDSAGDDLMYAKMEGSALRISDGHDEEGDVRWVKALPTGSSERVDLVLKGSTYVFHQDSTGPIEARTFQDATSGTFADASTVHWNGEIVDLEGQRMLGPAAWTTAFREPLDEEDGWSTHAPDGDVEQMDSTGHRSMSRLKIDAPVEDEALAYIHTPAPEGAFVAEASFRPRSADPALPTGIPDHQAVLAGLSGPVDDPDVDWALVMANHAPAKTLPWQDLVDITRPGHYWEWSLFFIDSDRTRTQVAPTWSVLDTWHAVRAHVDPATGAVEVQVDGNETALRFEDAFTGTSDRIATGDVIHDHPWWTGGRMGYYDNLAVDPISDQT